jgi:hypothetical protein
VHGLIPDIDSSEALEKGKDSRIQALFTPFLIALQGKGRQKIVKAK